MLSVLAQKHIYKVSLKAVRNQLLIKHWKQSNLRSLESLTKIFIMNLSVKSKVDHGVAPAINPVQQHHLAMNLKLKQLELTKMMNEKNQECLFLHRKKAYI